MTQRKAISKKMRFEVLKRDKFTCQYCGKQSPDVVLHLDHIKPVSKGGKNTLLNLVTSCVDCNLGKGARELSDESEIEKQKQQLAALAEKQDQVKLMIKWREQLIDCDELMVKSATKVMNDHIIDWSISDSSIGKIRSIVSSGKYSKLMDSINIAKGKYGYIEDNADANEFITLSLKLLSADQNPIKKKINYAKGIARNRFSYFDEASFYKKTAFAKTTEQCELIIELTKSSHNWSQFNAGLGIIEDNL